MDFSPKVFFSLRPGIRVFIIIIIFFKRCFIRTCFEVAAGYSRNLGTVEN